MIVITVVFGGGDAVSGSRVMCRLFFPCHLSVDRFVVIFFVEQKIQRYKQEFLRRKVCIKDVGPKGIGLVAKVSCLVFWLSPLPSPLSLGAAGFFFVVFSYRVYSSMRLLWWGAGDFCTGFRCA